MNRLSPPKALELLDLIDQYGEQIERDLLFYYGIDICDVMANEVSPRRVWNLLRYAPSDGAFKAALRGGDEYFEWDEERFFLAYLLEFTMFHRHEFLTANMPQKEAKKLKSPEQFELPGRKLPKKKESQGGFAAMLAQEKAYQEKLKQQQNK